MQRGRAAFVPRLRAVPAIAALVADDMGRGAAMPDAGRPAGFRHVPPAGFPELQISGAAGLVAVKPLLQRRGGSRLG